MVVGRKVKIQWTAALNYHDDGHRAFPVCREHGDPRGWQESVDGSLGTDLEVLLAGNHKVGAYCRVMYIF